LFMHSKDMFNKINYNNLTRNLDFTTWDE